MVKITIWLNEKKGDNPINFGGEDFTGEKIYDTAIELSEEMKEYKVRFEKIIKGEVVTNRKEFKRGKI